MPWTRSGLNRFIPSVIYQPRPPINKTLALLAERAVVVDVGAGGRRVRYGVMCVDFRPIENTDLVSDIHNLAIKDNSIDCIICTGVFEHIQQPAVALNEFHRILKRGGLVHIEVPFMQPFHADPVDYYRWTLDGLRFLCRQGGFEELVSGSHLGPASAMNAIVIAYVQSYFRNRYTRKAIDLLLSYLLFPFKYLDVFLCGRDQILSSGVYFVGVRDHSK